MKALCARHTRLLKETKKELGKTPDLLDWEDAMERSFRAHFNVRCDACANLNWEVKHNETI